MGKWVVKRMDEIVEFNPRETIQKGTVGKKISMEKLQPFCRDVPGFDMAVFSGGTKFRNGDTIMARITPCLENGKTAKVNVLDDGEVGFGSTEYIVLRAKEGYDPDFIYYLVTSPLVRDPAIKSMVGSSGRQRVQSDVVQRLLVKVPSLKVQEFISGILKALDDKILVNRRINENLLQQALCLFEEEFITKADIDEELPLYDFADYINGAAFKPDELGDVGLPVIKIAELKAGVTGSTRFYSGDKGQKYLVHNKDILFSWSGNPETSIDLFIWSDGDGILNQHTFNVKSKYGCPWFTFLMLKHHKPAFTRIASNKQTTGLGHVTATDLRRLAFPFDLDRMNTFETMVTPIMDLLYGNLLENRRLSSLRDTLLPKLMSGELDVSSIEF